MRGTIEKRGRGYRVSVFLGRDENGRQLRHRKTLSTKKAAEAYLRAKLLEFETEGKICRRTNDTLTAFLNRWLPTRRAHVRARTIEDYEDCVRRYIQGSALGNQLLVAIGPADIERFYSELGQRLAPATVRKVHAVIRGALRDARRWGQIPRNPAVDVQLPKIRRTRDIRIITVPEFPLFVKAALAEPRIGAMWVLALATGMRPEEYYGLVWPNVNGRNVTITQVLVRPRRKQPGEPRWRLEEPKTDGSSRTVMVDEKVAKLLHRHRVQQAKEKLAAGPAYEDQGFVFATALGQPLDHHNMSKRNFKRIIRRAGLSEGLTPYSLRHSAATALLKRKQPMKLISALLGHSSYRVTADVYSHVTDDMMEETAGVMGAVLFGR